MWEEWDADMKMMRPKAAWRPSAAGDLFGDILIYLY
jgi:hypothetical protein